MQKAKQRARQGYPMFKNEYANTRVVRKESVEEIDKAVVNPEKAKIQSYAVKEGKGDNDGANLSANIDSPSNRV